MAKEEYQPGLGLSNLRVAFQNYMVAENKRKEEEAKKREAMVATAEVGKSAYDYWAMDQMGKYKDLLSEKIDGKNVFQTSEKYKSDPLWKRMTTSAEGRVEISPAYQEKLDASKPKIPIDSFDLNEWSLPDTEMIDPDTFFIDDIPSGTDDIGALGVNNQDIPDLYNMYMDRNVATATPGPMTASAGMNDAWMTDPSGAELISSADEAVSATGEASKYSKFAGGASKALGIAGTAYGAYDLATNWDDMSDEERAQGILKTGGGALMASGVGVPIGLGLSAIGTIWDWLD